ncbi:hypothetical protein [Dipodfec virus UOA04_Rod_615]|nr:hypothetical protein [Dipodfec virus UOA04_Rod_615]
MNTRKNSRQSASILSRKQPKQLDLIEWTNKKQAKEAIKKYERETSNKLRSEIPSNSEPGEL